MQMDSERDGGVETIVLSQRPSTVSLIVAIMGLTLNLQIILVLVVHPMPWPLIAMLVGSGASAAWLGLIGLESIVATRVIMDKDAITIAKLLGERQIPWIDVADAKLVPSVGTLSDDASAAASGRLAVGLFLRTRKEPRLHELDADMIIFGASETHLKTLVRLTDHINDYKATIGAGLPDPQRRVRKAAPIVAAPAFRRPRSAA